MTGQPLATATDLWASAPEITLAIGGIVVLLLDALLPRSKHLCSALSLLAVVLAAALGWSVAPFGSSFGGLLETSALTVALSGIVLLSGALALLASHGYLRREGIFGGEYHALLLWCLAGLLLMVRAVELLTVFLALELLSICLYALAGYHRRLAIATEAALKYFLMGAFVSAFVLFGIALVYGETGSTRLDAVAAAMASGPTGPILTLGLFLLVCGFAFKMSLVPFHAWSPDAYQGAPSPFVAFLSVAPKAASVMVLVRLLELALPSAAAGPRWPDLVALIAVLSMVVGNLLALAQEDIKRMLAYSGIAHMGYVLIPLVALERGSWLPVLAYLLAYALMNAGAFIVVGMLYARAGEKHQITELSGWGYRFPLLGICLTVCLLSLGGIPPALGFVGKYLVFAHAIQHGRLWLALVGIATSLIGVFYYLRVVYTLYMKPEVGAPQGLLLDPWGRAAALIAALGTVVLGIWPSGLLEWIGEALSALS